MSAAAVALLGAPDLAEQAKGPVQAGVEMNNAPERGVATLNAMPDHVEAFKAAFPGAVDPVAYDNVALAVEAFEATLLTPTPASTSSCRATTTR